MQKSNIITLDVRPILEGGVDPFNAIMDELKKMDNNHTLLIINSFEPVPLLNILKDKGYTYVTERPEQSVVHTYIKKANEIADSQSAVTNKSKTNLSFDEIELKFKNRTTEIDVRDLEMPLPMVTILEEIEKIGNDNALYVHHKRLPQYLLPELEERGYSFVYLDIDDSSLKLIIFK